MKQKFTPDTSATIPERMHRNFAVSAMDYAERRELSTPERQELLSMIGYPPED